MEEKLDVTNVEVAAVRMPPAQADTPVTAACHYVPGAKQKPQFKSYDKAELEAAIGRAAAASS